MALGRAARDAIGPMDSGRRARRATRAARAGTASRRRPLSVRRSVLLALVVLGVIALGQMLINLQAFSAAAFMLKRAETSNRQLSAYQQLSIDLLDYIRAAQTATHPDDPAGDRKLPVLTDLTNLESLVKFEVRLIAESGGHETDDTESHRLQRIRAAIEHLVAAPGPAVAGGYDTMVKPLLADAVAQEQAEVEDVMRDMAGLQARMRFAGPVGMLLQLVTAGLVIAFIGRLVLDPLSRLVSDIRLLGDGTLAHRVAVERHDEFGLLAQNFNRMAASLERGRRLLVDSNDRLESTVAERTRDLSERNDELKEIDESRRRFFADVSHELRTPLTAIVGEADVTLRIAETSVAPYRAALGSILANSTYLNRRIDDLLALARPFDGRLDLDNRSVDLDQVAQAAVAEIQTLARINDVRVRFEPGEQALSVRGDRSRLRQCLMILLDNAVKFSRGAKTVTLTITRAGRMAHVSVVDTGNGIAADDLPHVFERFYQTEVGKRMGGTGLGLAIGRRIAEAHGGAVEAFGTEEGGTRVTLSLPLDDEETAA